MKKPRWYYVEQDAPVMTESAKFRMIVSNSTQSARDDVHAMEVEAMQEEYDDLLYALRHAAREGRDLPDARKMLADCVRALEREEK